MIVDIYIEDYKLDLFEDETIEVTSSVADIGDISKNTSDYSKSFTIPASANNNKIFKHYYDFNIDDPFDARVKVDGRIDIDGFLFRKGKFSLEKCIVKDGNPYSYSIFFNGSLVSLKDRFKLDKLSDLDLSVYDHPYNSQEVKDRFSVINDLSYVLLSKKRLYYNSAADNINTDSIANISFHGGANTGINWDLLKPAIKIIRIIQAIEVKYGITFSTDFIYDNVLNDLFLWVNKDSNIYGKATNTLQIDFDNIGGFTSTEINIIENYLRFDFNGFVFLRVTITPSAGYSNVGYSLKTIRNDGEPSVSALSFGTTDFDFAVGSGTKYSFEVESSSEFKFSSSIRRNLLQGNNVTNTFAYFAEQTINAIFQIKSNIPDIKVIDFFKGLVSMFKLVVIPTSENDIYLDTFEAFYKKGKIINITKYVDFSSYEVSRGKLLSEINFKFKDPTTILNAQFKKNNDLAYGDEQVLLTEDGSVNGKLIDGSSLKIELPFEQMVYEKLTDTNGGGDTNIVYGGVFSESLSPVNISSHLMYVSTTIPVSGKEVGFINGSLQKESLSQFNIPLHKKLNLPSLTFGIEVDEYSGESSDVNLYSEYYRSYVNSIFDVKSRDFKYEAILPLRVILNLKLNDVLEIRNNYFFVDNFTTNLVTGRTSLSLINAFNVNVGAFNSSTNQVIVGHYEQSYNVLIYSSVVPSATASSAPWLTFTTASGLVVFNFSYNGTGFNRTTQAIITNPTTLQTITINVIQLGGCITADNNQITVDNNQITVDNG